MRYLFWENRDLRMKYFGLHVLKHGELARQWHCDSTLDWPVTFNVF